MICSTVCFCLAILPSFFESQFNIHLGPIYWGQVRDAYVEQTEHDLLKIGLKRVPAKRKKKVAAEVRFEWAALRQCTETSIDDLADQYSVESEAIRVSTSRILKGLGFPPRT